MARKDFGAAAPTWPLFSSAAVSSPGSGRCALYSPDATNLLVKNSSGTNRAVGATVVKAATTANITLSGTQTIDAISIVATDWVLVKNQTTVADNGIYICAAGAWTRAPGWDSATAVASSEVVSVISGTVNGGGAWMTTFKSTHTLGTTAMNWFRMLAENAGGGEKPYIKSPGYRVTADFRNAINNVVAQQTSGQVTMQGIYLYAGDVVTTISIMSGGTAGATLTHSWAAICDSTRTVKAISADNTGAAWATNTTRDFTMGTPFTVPTTGWYYIALQVTGTTMPQFHGSTSSSGALAQEATGLNWFGKSSTTGLTTPSAVGTVYGAITNAVGWYYAWIS